MLSDLGVRFGCQSGTGGGTQNMLIYITNTAYIDPAICIILVLNVICLVINVFDRLFDHFTIEGSKNPSNEPTLSTISSDIQKHVDKLQKQLLELQKSHTSLLCMLSKQNAGYMNSKKTDTEIKITGVEYKPKNVSVDGVVFNWVGDNRPKVAVSCY